jgi:uncharacterized protein
MKVDMANLIARILGFALPMALSLPTFAAEPPSHYSLVQNTLEKHVVPHFQALNTAAVALPDAVTEVCTVGNDSTREELATAFRNTVVAWAGVEYLRFGPMIEGARRERMSFWPDARGIMNRQLRQLMTSKDEKAVELGAIAKQSAAVQGLPALEVLIADKDMPLGPAEASAFRCKLAVAIASNIKAISEELNQAWTKDGGWKDKMLRPGSDNDTYKEPQEAASELVKAFVTGLQLVADGEVKPRLDSKVAFAGPYAKSNLSAEYFGAGVASLEAFYDGMALESYLSEEKDWVKNWTGGAWKTLRASDGAGGRASGVAKGDDPPVPKVMGMFSGLRKIVTAELSVAAGLTVGFNELDGD